MQTTQNSSQLLHEIPNAAFLVANGVVTDANAAAAQHGISVGMDIASILGTGQEEYRQLTKGCLYLSLNLSGIPCGASVSRTPDYDLFLLEQEDDVSELQAMALAAQVLRNPLSNVMNVADRLFPLSDDSNTDYSREQVAKINKGLYQMLRIVSNMSDAYRYSQETAPKLEIRDIRSLMEELFNANKALIAHTGVSLTFENLPETIFCLVDAEKLERAVGNILSNALKFTPKGGSIDAKLTRKGKMLHLTVLDSGAGIPGHLRGNVYNHFQRTPGIEDGRFGIGLGIVLIRSAATAHGGTVLIDQPEGMGTRITMTMQIRQDSDPLVRASIISVDYAGGRDRRLLELSEHLPPELFESVN